MLEVNSFQTIHEDAKMLCGLDYTVIFGIFELFLYPIPDKKMPSTTFLRNCTPCLCFRYNKSPILHYQISRTVSIWIHEALLPLFLCKIYLRSRWGFICFNNSRSKRSLVSQRLEKMVLHFQRFWKNQVSLTFSQLFWQ